MSTRWTKLARWPLSFAALWAAACSGGGHDVSAQGEHDGAQGDDAGQPPAMDAGSAGPADAASSGAHDAGDASDGPGPSPLDASLEAFCAGTGTVVTVPTGDGESCLGDVIDQTFRFAVCSCTTLSWSGTLTTDSFDSSQGTTGQNASVGANQGASSSSRYDIAGSLWTAADGLSFTGSGRVAEDVHAGGGFHSTAPQTVEGDLYTDGAAGSYITVGGAVHAPAGTTLEQVTATGGVLNEAVAVAAPCNCATPLVDPAQVVDFIKGHNDNATGQVDAASLTDFHDPITLDLPCGRYFFDALSGSAPLTFKLAGRTVVAVDGGLALSGPFTFELAEGAELDLFVRGDLQFSGSNTWGDVAAPARFRVYAAGTKVQMSGGTHLGGNVYAPSARLSSSGNIEVSGSLFGREVAFTGETTVHYDEAILGHHGCEPPITTTCDDCNDCGNGAAACILGECQACATNGDCCPPLVCDEGTCVQPGVVM